jgi:hypothetical protein
MNIKQSRAASCGGIFDLLSKCNEATLFACSSK